ncbi:MAG: GDP-fucose synthetase [Elusimicrobia bacterium GWD2_63_28]|nr:MAG: GDP-fucose synthetase [Elusimicrobia bacterium GWD2_63_28]
MDHKDKIYIAGHSGLAGSALVRAFRAAGFNNLLLRAHAGLELEDQAATEAFFAAERPDYVVLAAAKVGGIKYNNAYPADFIRANLYITANILESARKHGVKRLVFFGSSCMYPKICPQPMKEDALMTGVMEPTSLPYSTAKLAGAVMCQAYNRQHGTQFLPIIPATLYGPGDNFNPEQSHVLPALLRRAHEARLAGAPALKVWGSGNPRREFLYIDDLAQAVLFLLGRDGYTDLTNIGAGTDLSIRELAEAACAAAGYKGRLEFDASQPDGTLRKLLDSSKMEALGWKAKTPLAEGLEKTYKYFLETCAG